MGAERTLKRGTRGTSEEVSEPDTFSQWRLETSDFFADLFPSERGQQTSTGVSAPCGTGFAGFAPVHTPGFEPGTFRF